MLGSCVALGRTATVSGAATNGMGAVLGAGAAALFVRVRLARAPHCGVVKAGAEPLARGEEEESSTS